MIRVSSGRRNIQDLILVGDQEDVDRAGGGICQWGRGRGICVLMRMVGKKDRSKEMVKECGSDYIRWYIRTDRSRWKLRLVVVLEQLTNRGFGRLRGINSSITSHLSTIL